MNIIGIFLGLFSALSEASLNTVVNKYKASYSPVLMGFAQLLFLLPVTLVMALIIPWPKFNWQLVIFLGIFCLLNVVGRILYIKSIHLSGLSKTVPFLSFTPVFLILSGFIILGEVPNLFGMIGLVLIVCGSYVLTCNKFGESFFAAIRNVKNEKGVLLAIATAFVWSLTSSFGKKAVMLSSPIFFFVMAINIQFILFLFINIRVTGIRKTINYFRNDIKFFLLASLFLGLMEFSIFTAYSLTKIVYAISMKRMAIFFSVLFGYLFFKETGFKKNIIAAIIMVVGVIIITILGK